MALAEATVRVVLDVSRFDRDLQAAVQKAAERAGKDFDREMQKNMRAAGRNATTSFRDAARTNMARAGRDMARDFENGFTQGTAQMGGRVGQRIGNGLRTNVSRAGIDAGRGFTNNLSRTIASQGENVGRDFAGALGVGMLNRLARAGADVGRLLGDSATASARRAGQNVGREFSLNIGLGSLRGSPALTAGIALLASEITTNLGPALGIIASAPPLFGALVTGVVAVVTAFEGMGDAFKAVNDADFEKLEESLQRLSPAARAVVREFAAFRPELSALRRDIQNAFFGSLQGEIGDLVSAFTGPLRGGIISTATSLGQLARGFTDTLVSAEGIRGMDQLFRGTADFFDQLKPGIRDVTRGFLEFTGAASPGLVSISKALSDMLSNWGRFLSQSAQSGKALEWIESGLNGLRNFKDTLSDLGAIFTIVLAAVRPLAVALSGVFDLVADLVRVFGSLPGPIQTAVAAALLLTRLGLPDFLRRTTAEGGGTRTMLSSLATAYREGATGAGEFIRRQTDLIAVSQAINGATDRTVQGIQRIGGAFATIAAPAAGAANVLRRGFGAAVSGLMNTLGGPWGIVLAGAGVALSIFASNQEKAAQSLARYNAGVREIQGTLNRTTGAITLATTEMAAADDRVKAASKSWREFGVSSDDVVQGALKAGVAHDRVESSLRREVAAVLEANRANGDLDAVLQATGLSQQELTTALLGGSKEMTRLGDIYSFLMNQGDGMSASVAGVIGRLKDQTSGLRDTRAGWVEYFNQTQKAQESQRLIAASMAPATREAQKLADAMGILADNTADADSKAQAFAAIMDVLAGGTIGVQAAMASWNEVLQKVAKATQEDVDKTKGYGSALVTANGQINTATVNGNNLFNTYQQLSQGLSTSTAALVDNALKTGDVSGALKQVSQNVQAARDSFIAQATAMGIPKTQAEQLANAYGLIPRDVITKLALPAYENVRAQLVDVQNKIKDIPPDKKVNVGVLSEEAKRRLDEIGFKTERLPDGSVEVIAHTQQAKSELSSLLANWSNRVINWAVNIFGGNALGNIIPKALGGIVKPYRRGGFHPRSMPANRAEMVKPKTYRMIGDRAIHDEAYIPINKSARSQMLLATTARRMDFDLVPRGRGSIAAAPSRTVNVGEINVNAPYAAPDLVARATINELARAAIG